MKLNAWKPSDSNGPYTRFYMQDNSGTFVGLKGRNMVIDGGTNENMSKLNIFLVENDIFINFISIKKLKELLDEKGVVDYSSKRKYNPKKKSSYDNVISGDFGKNIKSSQSLNNETRMQVASSCPFKAPTIKNGYIVVDSREPKELFDIIETINIDNIQYGSLPLGDIVIGDIRNKNILLIERKTITDLTKSIKNNHAHDQAERYFDEKERMARLGYDMQVIWIVEGEDNGDRMLYNCLEKGVNVDGWVNYIATIVGQQTIQSFNMNHTAYLVGKLAQGFIERKLYYPVRSGNPLINRKHESYVSSLAEDQGDHGVTRASNGLASMLSYIPAIKTNVATELAKTGKTYSEITQMSIKELLEIKGVGKKSAEEIYSDFNMKE